MNEKRFIFATNEKWFLLDNETEEYMDMEDCKDKLNELAEENKQLKLKIDGLAYALTYIKRIDVEIDLNG